MAFLQPANIPSRNDLPQRLQQVAGALRDQLPDEVTVWLERTGDGESAALRRELDPTNEALTGADTAAYLLLLDPRSGIAVLEAPAVARARRHLLRNRPLDIEQLRSDIAQRAEALQHSLGTDAPASLPVVHILALPQVHRESLPSAQPLSVLTAEDFAPGRLQSALGQLLAGQDHPLSNQEETRVRATVKPEVLIDDPEQPHTTKPRPLFGPPDGAETIRALDRQQERLARHLGGGYRLIRGVAGSGKTLILTHRAKHIAKHFADWRVLLLCYNRALARALEHEVEEANNIEAGTVDSLAYRLLDEVGRIDRGEDDPDFETRRRDALTVARLLDDSKRFDMVLVDEAQDLGSSGLDLAWAMLKSGRDNFIIALDSAQNLYRRRMAWNPPGMTARGRATVLSTNYRNTKEILDLAKSVLQGFGASSAGDPQSDHLDVFIEPEAALRHGVVPATYACADLPGEVSTIGNRIEELTEAGAAPGEIVVLSGSRALREGVLETVPGTVDVRKQRSDGVTVRRKVRVATLHWSKGLEFRHVIVGGANDIWLTDGDEIAQDEQQSRLLYVGMTRATESLTVTYSGGGIMNALAALPVR